jgi:isoquinoline 1-oxidoreductase alpha subunit
MILTINGKQHQVKVDPKMPLLWVLRDILNMTGTKYGCGVAACGACTVHIDGQPTRSCLFPVSSADGKEISTVEGLEAEHSSAVQQAWIKHQVPQCGYCQSGMIMATEALLNEISDPTDEDIDRQITNICRCGTYQRIRAAIKEAAQLRIQQVSAEEHEIQSS